MAESGEIKSGLEEDIKGKKVSNTPRKRVSQACERCRARKDKCDGVKPVCAACQASDAECIYDSNTKKRGLPEGYVRGIEKLWGLSIREVENVEDNVVDVLTRDGITDVWNDASDNTLQETWRSSRIAKELERLLPLLEIEEKTGKRKREAARAEASQDARAGKANVTINRHESPPMTSVSYAASNTTADSVRRPIVVQDAPPRKLPERAFRLIDIYFSYTHNWLPILEKYDIMRLSHQYSRPQQASTTSSPAQRSGDQAVLWAILAYSDCIRQSFSGPQEPSPETMYEYARTLIPNEDEAFDLGHVQALLILCLYNMGCGMWSRAWMLIGKAGRVTIDMRLNKQIASPPKRATHVFLGCFVLDTIIAARLDRRPQIRREDLGRSTVDEDGLEEWDPYSDCLGAAKATAEAAHGPAMILSTFNQLVRIMMILNDTICARNTTRVAAVITDLLQELRSVQRPMHLQSASKWDHEEQGGVPETQPHQYNLSMAYMATATTVYISATEVNLHGGSAMEIANDTIRQVGWILKDQAQQVGLLIAPPIYDYFTMIAARCCLMDLSPQEQSRVEIKHALKLMARSWRTFQSIDNYMATGDLDSGPTVEQKRQAPDAIASREAVVLNVSQHKRTESMHMLPPSGSVAFSIPRASPPIARFQPRDPDLAINTFGASPLISLAHNAQPSPSATYVPPSPFATHSWTGTTPGRDSFSNTAMTLPPLALEVDGDSAFNDFAVMDAMEWTNNWDQSLLNLGFTDPTSMNNEFYAFCREPDPLYPNSLVQQLLSGHSMVEGMPDMAGMDAGYSLNGNGTFLNPHVEASQILQQLASAQDHGVERRPD